MHAEGSIVCCDFKVKDAPPLTNSIFSLSKTGADEFVFSSVTQVTGTYFTQLPSFRNLSFLLFPAKRVYIYVCIY